CGREGREPRAPPARPAPAGAAPHEPGCGLSRTAWQPSLPPAARPLAAVPRRPRRGGARTRAPTKSPRLHPPPEPGCNGIPVHRLVLLLDTESNAHSMRSGRYHLSLADDGDTAGGHGQTAGPVMFFVHSDGDALQDGHVLVQDGVPDDGAAADTGIVQD